MTHAPTDLWAMTPAELVAYEAGLRDARAMMVASLHRYAFRAPKFPEPPERTLRVAAGALAREALR